MTDSKKYGLILSDKTKPTFQAARNVFGNDSDSEEDSKKKPILLRPSHNINRQAKITQEKALKDDPTVYQYDEVYDTMASQKEEKKEKSKEDKKPRYIENLLKTAGKRKIENERRLERQIQKDREKEGDEFADKEVFVTSAYKKKLEEMKLEEEKEKREEYLESIGDVTKQQDLGGFYRHIYEQRLGPDKKPESNSDQLDDNKKSLSTESETTLPTNIDDIKAEKKENKIKRNYRKRKSSADNAVNLSEGEIVDSDDEINRVNLEDIKQAKKNKIEENIDADSDFSIDESSDENDSENVDKKPKITEEAVFKTPSTPELPKPVNSSSVEDKKQVQEQKEKEVSPEPKPKIDIWKKRTVGAVFDEALKRYYERKANRG